MCIHATLKNVFLCDFPRWARGSVRWWIKQRESPLPNVSRSRSFRIQTYFTWSSSSRWFWHSSSCFKNNLKEKSKASRAWPRVITEARGRAETHHTDEFTEFTVGFGFLFVPQHKNPSSGRPEVSWNWFRDCGRISNTEMISWCVFKVSAPVTFN